MKVFCLRWNLIPRLIRIYRIRWWWSLFLFRPEVLSLGKFCPKNEDCYFKLKFGTLKNSNMQNSMALSSLSVFDWKYPFWASLVEKVKIVRLNWNLVASLIDYVEFNGVAHFFLFRPEILFLGKFSPKYQNWQFMVKPNLNKQDKMAVFTFSVLGLKYSFWANLVQKVKIVSLSWNLGTSLIRICRIDWCCSLFSFVTGNTLFVQIWSKKSKLSV